MTQKKRRPKCGKPMEKGKKRPEEPKVTKTLLSPPKQAPPTTIIHVRVVTQT